MERVPVTLICSAAATGLTSATHHLQEDASLSVIDLEEILKSRVVDWGAYPGEDQNMGTICSQTDRDGVLRLWERSFGLALDEIRRNSTTDTRAVLAAHLTLFSPTRLEFYAPPLLASLVQASGIVVTRVIVLIDDIYDMHARLSEPGKMYMPSQASREHLQHVMKLTGPVDDEAVSDLTDIELGAVTTESVVKNLLRLLHWRRSEMITGEELARNLSSLYGQRVPFTVLAVKHEMDSLRTLVSSETCRTAYVSHKITEPRQHNQAQKLAGHDNEWPTLVSQVNDLSVKFRQFGIIAIQPTAIDELRFDREVTEGARLSRYLGRLSDRWSIPSGTVYEHPNEGIDFTDLLAPNGSPYEKGLIGLLQHSIYDEIAFRDHLLVSCNDALVVYRPAAIGPRISSGVEEEVAHWSQSILDSTRPFRPAAFIHTAGEMHQLLNATNRSQLSATMGTSFLSLRHVYTLSTAQEIWQSIIDGAPITEALSAHLKRLPAGNPVARIESAISLAIAAGFSFACRADATVSHNLVHFIAADADEAGSTDFIRDIAVYLGDPSNQSRQNHRVAGVSRFATLTNHKSDVDLLRSMVTGRLARRKLRQ